MTLLITYVTERPNSKRWKDLLSVLWRQLFSNR